MGRSFLAEMSNVFADPSRSLQRPSEEPEFRLALVHDGSHDPAALLSILAGDRLPPNAGVLPLSLIGELVGSPPEAVVLAVDLSRRGGMAALRSLRREATEARIVVIARDTTGFCARQTLNSGADAFVSEQDAAGALAPAVRAVVAGLVCAPRVATRLIAKPTFSRRETQVLELVVAGMTNRQIAGRLYLAESTVKSHVTSAFKKLGVRSRTDAADILLDPAELPPAAALPPQRRGTRAPPRPARPQPQPLAVRTPASDRTRSRPKIA